MGGNFTPTPPQWHLDQHDANVIIFHVVVAALQAGLVALGSYSALFGPYAPYLMLSIQVGSEFVRRLVV